MVAYSDASFAPDGGRSHQGIILTIAMVPGFWKSSRQAIVALSVAEAELIAECDAFVAMKGMAELVAELLGYRPFRLLAVDNAAAVAITQGTAGPTPWRTRHLRIRSAALTEAQDNEDITISHVPGVYQCADIATKTLPVVVLRQLMALIVVCSMAQVTQSAPAVAGSSHRLWLVGTAVIGLPEVSAQFDQAEWAEVRSTLVELVTVMCFVLRPHLQIHIGSDRSLASTDAC